MLSIIIPTLNEEKFLPRLLESIKEQDYSDYEIIISDGGSSDKTENIAKSFGCIFISDSSYRHPSKQRNDGAAIARGDQLLFLDADSVLQLGFLSKVSEEFSSQRLTGAGFYFHFNPNKPSYEVFAAIYNSFCFFRQFISPAAVGAAIMARRDAHEKIGGFDLAILLAEDYDYCARLARQGKFRMIKSIHLLYSSRRIHKDGYFKTAYAWAKMGSYTIFHRRITSDKKIKYEFGKY